MTYIRDSDDEDDDDHNYHNNHYDEDYNNSNYEFLFKHVDLFWEIINSCKSCTWHTPLMIFFINDSNSVENSFSWIHAIEPHWAVHILIIKIVFMQFKCRGDVDGKNGILLSAVIQHQINYAHLSPY